MQSLIVHVILLMVMLSNVQCTEKSRPRTPKASDDSCGDPPTVKGNRVDNDILAQVQEIVDMKDISRTSKTLLNKEHRSEKIDAFLQRKINGFLDLTPPVVSKADGNAVATCHKGLAFGAHITGKSDDRIKCKWDGSWEPWAKAGELPCELVPLMYNNLYWLHSDTGANAEIKKFEPTLNYSTGKIYPLANQAQRVQTKKIINPWFVMDLGDVYDTVYVQISFTTVNRFIEVATLMTWVYEKDQSPARGAVCAYLNETKPTIYAILCARGIVKGKYLVIRARNPINESNFTQELKWNQLVVFGISCPHGHTGDFCETETTNIDDINVCQPDTCQNRGQCVNLEGDSFDCVCMGGFVGERCESNVDECQYKPCQNGGSCTDTHGSFMCQCLPGMYGIICETEDTSMVECTQDTCKLGINCTTTIVGTMCKCPRSVGGYTGPECDVEAQKRFEERDNINASVEQIVKENHNVLFMAAGLGLGLLLVVSGIIVILLLYRMKTKRSSRK